MIQLCKACTEQPVCCVNLSECAGQRYRAVRSASQRQWGGQRRCCGAETETEVTSQLVAVKGRTAEQCVKQTLELLHPSHLSSLHIHHESSVGLSASASVTAGHVERSHQSLTSGLPVEPGGRDPGIFLFCLLYNMTVLQDLNEA